MTTRVLLAGLLAAIGMFLWSFVAHMVLPLGEAGVREIPNEAAVLSVLQQNLGENRGFYFFPGSGLGPEASAADRRKAMEESAKTYDTKPTGILVYRPPGRPFAFGKWLTREFLLELIEALLAVILLAQTRLEGFLGRVAFVTGVGLVAAITTNLSYLNWYGFPRVYTASYMFTQIIGFLCAGVVAALVLKNRQFGRA